MNGLAGDIGPIGKSGSMDETFHRAHRLALVQGHGQVTLEHMLFALTEDPDAIGVLSASGIVIDKLRTDVSAHLGRLNETLPAPGSAGAQPGPDLLRIVQLAASAARQSPRKQIDGAIILAAIIGEAKSPAAGMLKAHGLTFEEVIRVLQRAQTAQTSRPAAPPMPPRPAPPAPPPAPQQRAQEPLPPPPMPPAPTTAQSVAGTSSEPPMPGITRATLSTEEILASVRARVKQAEPPPLSTRAPATPLPAAPAQAGSPIPAQNAPQTAKATIAPRPPMPETHPAPDQPAASETLLTPPLPAEAPKIAVAETPTLKDNSDPKVNRSEAAIPSTVADAAAPSPIPQAKSEPAERKSPPQQSVHTTTDTPLTPSRSSAFDALANAPRVPAPQQQPKPTPPPLPPAPPALRSSPPQQPPLNQPKAHIQSAQYPLTSPEPRAAPQTYPAATQAPSYVPAPSHVPPYSHGMAALKPAAPLDIIAAARGIPGEIPVGESVVVEIRIPRDQLDIVRPPIQASAARVEPPLTRSVSVQLVSEIPGALAITPLSSETIWYDRPAMTAAEDGIWRFALTPVLKGKHGVTLTVHGRTIGPYGVQLDPAAVSETFEVTVRRYLGTRILRLGGYVAVFVLGALVTNLAGARIAETISSWVKLVMK